MKKRKLVPIVLSTVLMATSMCACDVNTDTPVIGKIVGLDSDQIFQVDDLICSKAEYALVFMDTQNSYKRDLGAHVNWDTKVDENTTLGDFIRDKVKEKLTVKYTLAAMADSQGITLSQDEKTIISNKANEYYNSLTSEEKKYTEASETDVETLYKNFMLADKVYESFTRNVGANVSEEEARVIKIQYIRMSTENNKAGDIESTMKEVKDLVDGGYQTFEREAKQYSEDSIVEKVLKKNEVSELYEKEAFKLGNKQISTIIKDGNNYYLIYCVSSYMKKETQANREQLINTMKDNTMKTEYNAFVEQSDIDFNTEQWQKFKLSDDANINNTSLVSIYNSNN